MTPSASTAWPCASTISSAAAPSPLFFLDYIACGKNYPEPHRRHRLRHHRGLPPGRCALVGGETAEMPGFYPDEEYDLAGFSVGLVDEEKIIDGRRLSEADVLIGLASTGVHSNGFSLVRKVLDVEQRRPERRPVRIWAARAWARPCWPPPASMSRR